MSIIKHQVAIDEPLCTEASTNTHVESTIATKQLTSRTCLAILFSLVEAGSLGITKGQEVGDFWFVQVDEAGRYYLKIRTMKRDAQFEGVDPSAVNGNGQIHNDPRVISSFHEVLRRTKLDEFPQGIQWITGNTIGRLLNTKMINLFGVRPHNFARRELTPLNEHDECLYEQQLPGLFSPVYALPTDASLTDITNTERAFMRYQHWYGPFAAALKFGPNIVRGLGKRFVSKFIPEI